MNQSQSLKAERNKSIEILAAATLNCYGLDKDPREILEEPPCFVAPMDVFGRKEEICQVSSIDVSMLSSAKLKKNMTRSDLIGVCTAIQASRQIDLASYDPQRVGLFVGCGSTQVEDLLPYLNLTQRCVNEESPIMDSDVDLRRFGQELIGSVNPMVLLQSLMNNVLCYVSIELGIKGVNGNYVELQTSSYRALLEALRCLRLGLCDVAMVCATSATPTPIGLYEARMKQGDRFFQYPIGEGAVCLILGVSDRKEEDKGVGRPSICIETMQYGACPDSHFMDVYAGPLKERIGHTQEASFLFDVHLAWRLLMCLPTGSSEYYVSCQDFNVEHGYLKLISTVETI